MRRVSICVATAHTIFCSTLWSLDRDFGIWSPTWLKYTGGGTEALKTKDWRSISLFCILDVGGWLNTHTNCETWWASEISGANSTAFRNSRCVIQQVKLLSHSSPSAHSIQCCPWASHCTSWAFPTNTMGIRAAYFEGLVIMMHMEKTVLRFLRKAVGKA